MKQQFDQNQSPFPVKLFEILSDAEEKGWDHIISWQLDGRAFLVRDPDAFVSRVMPLYFRQTKFKSFQRQLNLYGFTRFSRGPHKGCYMHEHFVRGRVCDLAALVCRKKDQLSDLDFVNGPTATSLASLAPGIVTPTMGPNAFPKIAPTPMAGNPMDLVYFDHSHNVQPISEEREGAGLPDGALERLLDSMIEGVEDESGTLQGYNVSEEGRTVSPANSGGSHMLGSKNPNSKHAFPLKLYDMLMDIEVAGMSDVVSWEMDGRGFRVQKQAVFVREVMPKYFNQTKYESFQRQLNLYDFTRVTRGPMKGCYYHSSFVRGNREQCLSMARKTKAGPLPVLPTESVAPKFSLQDMKSFSMGPPPGILPLSGPVPQAVAMPSLVSEGSLHYFGI